MQIVNILEIIKGIPSKIESFPIYEDQLDQEVVEKAEELFKKMILENHSFDDETEEDELEECLDNSYFDDNHGYKIYIIWSEIN